MAKAKKIRKNKNFKLFFLVLGLLLAIGVLVFSNYLSKTSTSTDTKAAGRKQCSDYRSAQGCPKNLGCAPSGKWCKFVGTTTQITQIEYRRQVVNDLPDQWVDCSRFRQSDCYNYNKTKGKCSWNGKNCAQSTQGVQQMINDYINKYSNLIEACPDHGTSQSGCPYDRCTIYKIPGAGINACVRVK